MWWMQQMAEDVKTNLYHAKKTACIGNICTYSNWLIYLWLTSGTYLQMVFYMFFMLHQKSAQRESFQNSVKLCQACYINNLFSVKLLVQDPLYLHCLWFLY